MYPSGMRIQSDTYIFSPDLDLDLLLFSSDPDLAGSVTFLPDLDPTCNSGYKYYFYLEQNINQNQQI